MIHHEREIWDNDCICAILDMIDTMHLGINDGQYPYVVPLSFGYHLEDKQLEIYFHCARQGYKLDLIRKNPHVCCTFSAFSNFPKKMYKGHRHDYRSVMAFGEVSMVDIEKDPAEFRKALHALLKHYDRIPEKGEKRGFKNFDPQRLADLYMMKIVCDRADVFAKSECPVRRVEDVPFVDVYRIPQDDTPDEVSDLVHREKRAGWTGKPGKYAKAEQ